MSAVFDAALALAPVAGLAVNAAVLVAVVRVRPTRGLLQSEYAAFVSGAAVVLVINVLGWQKGDRQETVDIVAHGILTLGSYAALGYCHFHFVNLGETARRIRLLRELIEAGGSMTHRDLLAHYNSREIVVRRIDRLVNAGQIVDREGRYFVGKPVVVMFARTMVAMKIFLLGKKSEHERS